MRRQVLVRNLQKLKQVIGQLVWRCPVLLQVDEITSSRLTTSCRLSHVSYYIYSITTSLCNRPSQDTETGTIASHPSTLRLPVRFSCQRHLPHVLWGMCR